MTVTDLISFALLACASWRLEPPHAPSAASEPCTPTPTAA